MLHIIRQVRRVAYTHKPMSQTHLRRHQGGGGQTQRLEPVTEALFLQRDFRDQEMLSQFARQLQNQDASAQPEADLYEGIDALHGRLLGCRGCIRFLYVKLQDSEHTQNTLALNMQHFQRHRSSKLIVEYDAN